MKIARSLAAVVAGYAVMAALLRGMAALPWTIGIGTFAVATILGSIAGGFTAAWIAGSHEIPHAAGVGFLMIAVTAAALKRQGLTRPDWNLIVVGGCGPIAALLGASLRMLSKRQSST